MVDEWICPDCEREMSTHYCKEKRPFCPECEDRHAVLIEMKPQKGWKGVEPPHGTNVPSHKELKDGDSG